MNLHRDIARRKLILVMFIASVLLLLACYAVGMEEGWLGEQPSAPAAGTLEILPEQQNMPGEEMTYSPVDETPESTAPEPQTTQTAPPAPAPESGRLSRIECGGRLTVVTESANVRTDADKDADFVRVIHQGESYDVIAQKPSTGRILWFEIRLDENTTGYVAGTYVKYDGRIEDGRAYLTFDDGPSENTRRILDILDNYGAKATFFVIYHANEEDTYRDIVRRGHTIALHSYSHDYADIYSSENAYYRDLDRLSDYVHGVTGERSRIIRFPGGSSNSISKSYNEGIMSRLTRSVENNGYIYYDWDVDSNDASDVLVPAETICRNVKEGVFNRRDPIILMHDSKIKTTTVDALPEIIEYLQSRGYALLPITPDTPPSHQRVSN